MINLGIAKDFIVQFIAQPVKIIYVQKSARLQDN